jgi:hypothetical protein
MHAFACGQSTIKPNVLSSTRIINGTEADRHSWPWVWFIPEKQRFLIFDLDCNNSTSSHWTFLWWINNRC